MSSISERLKTLRGDMNQSEFGEQFGLSQRTVSRYETGGGTPDIETVNLISAKFGVTPQWLAFGISPMRPSGDASCPAEKSNVKEGKELGAAIPALYERLYLAHEKVQKLLEDKMNLVKENAELKAELLLLKNGRQSHDPASNLQNAG